MMHEATVFVVEGQKARKGVYTIKGERGGTLFVDPALAPGSHVVTEGRSLLKDGDRVEAKLESALEPRDAGAALTAEVKN